MLSDLPGSTALAEQLFFVADMIIRLYTLQDEEIEAVRQQQQLQLQLQRHNVLAGNKTLTLPSQQQTMAQNQALQMLLQQRASAAAAIGRPFAGMPPAPLAMPRAPGVQLPGVWPPAPAPSSQPGIRPDPVALAQAQREDQLRVLPRRGLTAVLKAAGLQGTVRLDPVLETAIMQVECGTKRIVVWKCNFGRMGEPCDGSLTNAGCLSLDSDTYTNCLV